MLSDDQLPRRDAGDLEEVYLTTQGSNAAFVSIDLSEGLAELLHSRLEVGSSMLEPLNLVLLGCNDFLQAPGDTHHSCITLHMHEIGVKQASQQTRLMHNACVL